MNTNTDNNNQTNAAVRANPLLNPVEIMALVIIGKLATNCQLTRDNIEHGAADGLRAAIEDGIIDALADVDMHELNAIANDAKSKLYPTNR